MLDLIYKLRKFIYALFIISVFGAVCTENDFTLLGWSWMISALVFGGLAMFTIKPEE